MRSIRWLLIWKIIIKEDKQLKKSWIVKNSKRKYQEQKRIKDETGVEEEENSFLFSHD